MLATRIFRLSARTRINNPCRFMNEDRTKIVIAKFDESVTKNVKDGLIKPYEQPGRIMGSVHPPKLDENIIDAINVILGDSKHKVLVNDATKFCEYLYMRQPPCPEDERKEKSAIAFNEVYEASKYDFNEMSKEAIIDAKRKLSLKADKLLTSRIYNWVPINYNRYIAKQYLVERLSPEYSIMMKIFKELLLHHENYKPHSLFDLGSGVGSVTCAARKLWKSSIEEYFCVDPSRDMLDVARELQTGGDPDAEVPFKNVYYRQFMPTTAGRKYSLTVCAYTLMEFPSTELRLKSLLQLWNKTEDYMIIVDRAHSPGFNLVVEARDFILEIERNNQNKNVHAVAPCPHDSTCPAKNEDLKDKFISKCRSKASYLRLPFARTQLLINEYFTYVILAKSRRSPDDPQWPRVVRPPSKRGRRTLCYLCTKEAVIKHVCLGKNMIGTHNHQICKTAREGDRLPIIGFEEGISENIKYYNKISEKYEKDS